MVYMVADQICFYKHCCIYDGSASVCYGWWRKSVFGVFSDQIIYSLIQYFRGQAIEGYTTTILLLLLIGSAIMLSLGVIGYYLAKIYEEVETSSAIYCVTDRAWKQRCNGQCQT